MSSSITALDSTESHHKSQYNPTFHQDLLRAQTAALENEEKKLFSTKNTHLNKKSIISSSSRKNGIPISNNAQMSDYKSSSIPNKTSNQTHSCPINQDDKLITQLFNHINRPLPDYLRPRQSNTKEWFHTLSNKILFN
jgi:hypothetical protein